MGYRWNSQTPLNLSVVDVASQKICLTTNASYVQLIFTRTLISTRIASFLMGRESILNAQTVKSGFPL